METRNYDHTEWGSGDVPNRCLSSATAYLYGICEAAILAAGYAPAVGFIHTGKPQSFVYDIADIFKFETVVPVAFRIASKKGCNPERDVRIACRDAFRQSKILQRIIPTIEQVLAAGERSPSLVIFLLNSRISRSFFSLTYSCIAETMALVLI